jgi:3-oxoacyl-[acyl-carrier protein] reductase
MEGARRLIEDAATHFVRIDVLINNVGPFAMAAIAETSVEEWQRLLAGNLHGGFYCAKYVLPILRRQGGGHIIFIGSPKANSTRARQNVAAYGIAKTGVVLLAKTLAREEGPNGIRANVINPGIIDTGRLSDEEREDFIRQIPLRRLGTPADVAGAVLFLLSPLGEYCNGCTLNVDGGLWL